MLCRIVSVSDRLVAYEQALHWQRALFAARRAGEIPDTLLLLEHPPVVTFGRSAPGEADLISTRENLIARGIEVVEADRGGRITYHGPGQLVGYPIFDLSQREEERDLHRYLRNLEEALIDALAVFGIEGGRAAGQTGVWVGGRKIAAIGIKAARWVTMHGFALNMKCDLGVFREDIVPCGIRDKDVTSMSECDVSPSRAEVEAAVVNALCRVMRRVGEYADSLPLLTAVERSAVEGILAA
jgi:lipoate-protein ligase B